MTTTPLYTSVLDKPRATSSAATPPPRWRRRRRRARAARPAAQHSAGVQGRDHRSAGRLIVNDKRYSVYTYDKDGPRQQVQLLDTAASHLEPGAGARVRAAAGRMDHRRALARRPPVGLPQEAGLYLYLRDQDRAARTGSDIPGWHNVYTQLARRSRRPDFTVQETFAGIVLADAQGQDHLLSMPAATTRRISCPAITMDSPAGLPHRHLRRRRCGPLPEDLALCRRGQGREAVSKSGRHRHRSQDRHFARPGQRDRCMCGPIATGRSTPMPATKPGDLEGDARRVQRPRATASRLSGSATISTAAAG
jgi:hypothetical protein